MLNMPNLALSQFFAHISMQCFEGMTETCSSLTFMTLYDPTTDNSSHSFHVTCNIDSSLVHQPKGVCVGKAAPHVELRISSEDCSHVGRILTRGPHVMLGYWGQIPLEALSAGGDSWIDTGDIGWIDDFGNVWLVGRSKGRIKSGGENVYPEEVEAILSQHPGVSGIVVVGLPDARLTEVVVACLQIRDNWRWADSCSDHLAGKKDQTLSTQILQQFCRKMNLTG
ncbi:hypothetical protein CsSME_00029994 [Camellia sinensis var. sinensis]